MLVPMAHLSIRIDFDPTGSALGPGMAELLERIDKLGSIRKASISMGMSYRKAWTILGELEHNFGGPIVKTEIGGWRGGGAKLTELGHLLFKTFRDIEKNATQATKAQMAALHAMVQSDAYPRRKRYGK
jgi:molybdate transport system regulatory protein